MEKNGYEKTYDLMVPQLANCDFTQVAPLLGLEVSPDGCVRVDFLRQQYAIDRLGVKDEGGEGRADVNRKTALIYYLISGGHGEPSYEFLLLHNFSQGLFLGGDRSLDWTASSLGKLFEGEPGKFDRAMDILGAAPVLAKGGADAIRHYRLLPKMPVEIAYFDADEDFPCMVKFKFDRTALVFVPFETLAVMNGCLIEEILAIGKEL